jgi:predicted pyridoxine 5'-phosphate oxidase superfamily flavin-nucleotide-binding protein
MNEFYSEEQRALQDRFETREIADAHLAANAAGILHDEVREPQKAFIESRDMFFLSTVDSMGQPTCSYKGGDPGFVRVVNAKTIVFPSYDGNGMFFSLGNIQATSRVGMLFIDFERPNRLRLHGTATVAEDDPLIEDYPGAEMIVRVAVGNLFVNCPRYVHRYQKVTASRYVPRAESATPLAEWKRIDLLQDALPPRDRTKIDPAGGVITVEEYDAKVAAGTGEG